jgi:hypothetical protein
MKKIVLFALLLCGGICASAQNLKPFTVEGNEEKYNMIRVVNETSQDTLNCRVVILNEDNQTSEIYGVFNLTAKYDQDSKVKWLNRGTKMAVEMPKDFPVETSIAVEYVDRPVWDFLIIHITDAAKF